MAGSNPVSLAYKKGRLIKRPFFFAYFSAPEPDDVEVETPVN